MTNYAVREVQAGLCTGTLRAPAIQSAIADMARQGWKFEQSEAIIGRCCLIFQRYKMILIFSKTSD